jgi:hypothetical protein
MKKSILVFFAAVLAACVLSAGERVELSKIEHFCPKGRVQDREYNPHLPVIDTLIEKGTNAIPLLIEMLSDDTPIDHQIIDYWPSHTVGDIAFVILTDLTTDSSWKTSTIPGASWDEVLGRPDTNYFIIPGYYQLQDFKQKHGSKEIQRRWQKVWLEHQAQIYWDPKERCFKLRSSQKAPNHTAPNR